MNQLDQRLVLCDLDHLLLGAGWKPDSGCAGRAAAVRPPRRRFTVFSQRTPRAVRSILGSVRLNAPALVCGGAMAYHFADGTSRTLCSFAGQDADLFTRLPDAAGVGVALQMTDGTTRVLRMSEALERHLRQEWTPLSAGECSGYQGGRSAAGAAVSGQQGRAHDLAAGKIAGGSYSGAAGRACRSRYPDPDAQNRFRPRNAGCCVYAGGHQSGGCSGAVGRMSMLELVRNASQSVAAADAPPELRLAAQKVTLTDAAAGSAVEVLYRMVRDAENLA